ncbi:hypothetical protein [Cesiribacter sp. SM1]|uniref:hypothetical protein n=1 Tax=Cesiribacter sp. SM1 TaxID=2861196 RepID=UPI001CD596BC|nr:hypothetical protein [Cesiribacter sp. SM1]
MKDDNKNNKQQENNKQQQNEVSPYSRGKSMNPTQNPDLNSDGFTKSMKQQTRANNAEGHAQTAHPNNSPGHVND